jgi:HEPN domain-containing protein
MSHELCKAWLDSARADLKSIEYILEDEFLTHIVGFHAQQCVEKCFKGLLENFKERVPKEHSTLKLYGMVKQNLPEEMDIDLLTDLDDLYIDSRYPGEFGLLPHGKPSLEEAKEFYEFARHVFQKVCNVLDIQTG